MHTQSLQQPRDLRSVYPPRLVALIPVSALFVPLCNCSIKKKTAPKSIVSSRYFPLIVKIRSYSLSLSHLCAPICGYTAHVVMHRGDHRDRFFVHVHSGEHPSEMRNSGQPLVYQFSRQVIQLQVNVIFLLADASAKDHAVMYFFLEKRYHMRHIYTMMTRNQLQFMPTNNRLHVVYYRDIAQADNSGWDSQGRLSYLSLSDNKLKN